MRALGQAKRVSAVTTEQLRERSSGCRSVESHLGVRWTLNCFGGQSHHVQPLTPPLASHNLLVMRSHADILAEDKLSRTLAALADPTRRSILEQLSLGATSVKELAKPYDMTQPAVSKHLKVLEAAGLVSQEPGNRLGPRHLELQPFLKAAEWMDAYARIWSARLNCLGGPAGTASRRSRS